MTPHSIIQMIIIAAIFIFLLVITLDIEGRVSRLEVMGVVPVTHEIATSQP